MSQLIISELAAVRFLASEVNLQRQAIVPTTSHHLHPQNRLFTIQSTIPVPIFLTFHSSLEYYNSFIELLDVSQTMAPPLQKTIYTGTFIHTPSLTHLKILENTAVGVDEDGIIAFIERLDDLYSGGSMADVLRRRLGGEVGMVWAEGVERGEGGVRWVEGGDFGGGGGGGGEQGEQGERGKWGWRREGRGGFRVSWVSLVLILFLFFFSF